MGSISPKPDDNARLTVLRLPTNSQAWATSVVFHTVMLGLVACWTFPVPERQNSLSIRSQWSETTSQTPLPEYDRVAELTVPTLNASSTLPHQPVSDLLPTTQNSLPDPTSAPPAVSFHELSLAALDLADPVPEGRQTGQTSRGTGNGAGDGPGFFGKSPDESRIVYVVDNSRSMNRPHDSPAKTRFRRVKLELVKSISQMGEHQGFFVIFFARDTFPMPATDLQSATPAAKHHYLQWVSKMSSEGAPTDPREALQQALYLSPDKIYFLTDGEFDTRINRQLEKLQQTKIRIDTFAFGDQIGEPLLKQIAANNGGTYTFIP